MSTKSLVGGEASQDKFRMPMYFIIAMRIHTMMLEGLDTSISRGKILDCPRAFVERINCLKPVLASSGENSEIGVYKGY